MHEKWARLKSESFVELNLNYHEANAMQKRAKKKWHRKCRVFCHGGCNLQLRQVLPNAPIKMHQIRNMCVEFSVTAKSNCRRKPFAHLQQSVIKQRNAILIEMMHWLCTRSVQLQFIQYDGNANYLAHRWEFDVTEVWKEHFLVEVLKIYYTSIQRWIPNRSTLCHNYRLICGGIYTVVLKIDYGERKQMIRKRWTWYRYYVVITAHAIECRGIMSNGHFCIRLLKKRYK